MESGLNWENVRTQLMARQFSAQHLFNRYGELGGNSAPSLRPAPYVGLPNSAAGLGGKSLGQRNLAACHLDGLNERG